MKKVFFIDRFGKLVSKEVIDDYVLQDNELPEQPVVVHNPSPTEQLLMQQSQRLTILQSIMMQQNQDNAKLQSANNQQTTQIKQLQQMFMLANQQQAIEKSKEVNA